ncbi:MAG TPA: lysyl oxidase family protein, partial [Myxococcota bacterium]
ARRDGQFFCSLDGSLPQGISKGWADTYGKHLDCQWVDITGVPAGTYTLEVHVNPQHIFDELDLMNNVARVPVEIPADPNACVPNPAGELCHNGEDDDCDGDVDDGCAPVEGADTCDNGFTLDGNGMVLGTIAENDASSSSPSCGGDGGEFVVHFNVASDGIVYLSTYGSDIDTTLSIYTDTDCAPADEVLCADDGCVDDGGNGGAHLLELMTGGAYTAVVKAKHAGEGGNVQLKVQHAGCADAHFLADAGDDADVDGNLAVGASRDSTAPSCLEGCDEGGRDELWYFATCPGPHVVDVTTCGDDPSSDRTRFDTMIELREGACLGRPVVDSCNDDVETGRVRCSQNRSELQSDIGAGDGIWFVLVDGCGVQATPPDGNGEYELHLEVDPR